MKICFFSGNINNTGGTERVCLLIANELSKCYEVSILSFNYGDNPIFICSQNIKLFSLHLENSSGFISRKVNPYIRLKKFLKNNPQDILINVDVILALYSIPLKLFFKTKIISWEHFNFKINNGTKNRDIARKLSAKYADYIIVLTKADLDMYKSNLKLKCPIVNIYNPIVGNVKKNNKKENIVLASGRFTYAKNFQELIEIWEKVETKNPQWKLLICGNGEDFNSIKELILKKELKNVVLPGFCKNMADYYNKASIFVMTSRNEGFPMVLLEAQQHSIPIISYDCLTGPSEIIENGKNGYLIKYGDKNDFINKLNNLMNNKEKLNLFSENSSLLIKKYNINRIIDKWDKVIKELK